MIEANELIKCMTLIYRQQHDIYKEILSLVMQEEELIRAENDLALSGLLQAQENLIQEARLLNDAIKNLKGILLYALPVKGLSIEQLVFIVRPEVYISLSSIIFEINSLFLKIHDKKGTNALLTEKRWPQEIVEKRPVELTVSQIKHYAAMG